ncbi:hypothetical protein BpHYR1_054532 [Brachionus plicatilis]|uniref:Uncharacterized protein n=1 Tax=Brachionus plicatilis TaxID=10195 RepID=A0A3M7R2R0_BRAPC|nr:hypothetical protein BpHYR1_054532 [Brachionus plicatilis]
MEWNGPVLSQHISHSTQKVDSRLLIEAGAENECELNLYFSKHSAQKGTLVNDQDTLESQSIDEATDEMLNLSSVSLANTNDGCKREYAHVPKSLVESNSRTKLFNSLFRVFKKKDMSPAVQLYKCSQVLDVKLVHIEDHLEFYVQPNSRIGDLAHLEACLNQYAKVLVNDATLTSDLTHFQSKTSRFDVVLVLHEAQWKRAVFLERTSTTTLCSMFDYDYDFDYDRCATSHDISFYSFFLVDWGREILVKRQNGHHNTQLFILPYDQKLTSVGWFALKCKISEHQIKLREKIGSPNANNQTRTHLFDQKFSELFKDKVLRMRISQIVNLKNELTATVDLYFLPHQIQHLLKIKDQQIHQLKSNLNKSNVNCVQFVLDQIKQFEQTVNVTPTHI